MAPYAPPPTGTSTGGASNGMAVAALVLGILTFVCLGPIAGVLAIVFGVLGLKKANEVGTGRGMSIAGMILGIVGTVATIVILIVVLATADTVSNKVEDAFDSANPDDYELTSDRCTLDDFGFATFEGTIENTSNEELSFTIDAEITDGSGTLLDSPSTLVTVSEGRTAQWSMVGDVGDATDVSCKVVRVGDFFNFN